MRHVDHLDRLNFDQFKVSVKASDVFRRWNPIVCWRNRSISRCISGSPKRAARSGAVKSAIGLGYCCPRIGDTLRVSLAADPVEEIKVGFDILKSLRIRSRGINFIACPTCSRRSLTLSVR